MAVAGVCVCVSVTRLADVAGTDSVLTSTSSATDSWRSKPHRLRTGWKTGLGGGKGGTARGVKEKGGI